MKKLTILLLLSLCMGLFSACNAKPDTTTTPGEEYNIITVAEALELCGEEGNITTERYYIKATVDSITNAQYGAMVISDSTGTISVYNTMNADGSVSFADMEETPSKGAEVLLYCILQNYNGTKEVKSAHLIRFTQLVLDETAYTDMSITDARGTPNGTKVKVDGVVAQITYAYGQIPSGVYLVDDTNCIYIYDRDLAGRVKVGNKITVLARKTMWILEDEAANAEKFGYKGCCQLEDAYLTMLDDKDNYQFDTAWIRESTVKEILETPVSENITTTIYKVNALVSKQEGTGFTNYYFYDLDGKTGSYTYTQCSGADFAWLDQYDGKICTVYLSVINAKSTKTDCFYRLLPVMVRDENFQFDMVDAAEHAVKYYGVGQFLSEYTGDPALELMTSVSSELLGFRNAALTYSSSDTDIIDFRTENGKVVMHCVKDGTATITVTGSYNGQHFAVKLDITRTSTGAVSASNVDQIHSSAANGDVVTVKGIVGPSLVNQSGFYLIDDTGIIAVRMDANVLAALEIGHEVILEGTFFRSGEDTSKQGKQTRIDNATVVTNNYGSHEYATGHFVTDKTLADFHSLDVDVDYTTTVFVFKATVQVTGNNYYTAIKLTDGKNTISLYCSSANQYEFLKAYNGQEITIEIAACNWNDKNYYAGCVLAIRTEDGKILNTLNFQNR